MYERCIYFNLSTLNRKITKIWQNEFSFLGLSSSHGYLLAAMADKPLASQKELSEIMELDASTVTRFIDQLNAKRLIEKVTTGKGATFSLTPRGIEISARANELMDRLFSDMQERVGEKNLTKLVNNLRQTKEIFKQN